MNALNSPMEALAFDNHLSFSSLSTVRNLCALVAVVTATAAVSFWRIRAAGTDSADKISEPRQRMNPAEHHMPKAVSSPQTLAVESTVPAAAADQPADSIPKSTKKKKVAPTTSSDRVDEGTKRRKFTAYYEIDDDGGEGDRCLTSAGRVEPEDDGFGDFVAARGGGAKGEEVWGECLMRTLRMRTGTAYWYGYQDLTVLDGSVVRLWDDCCCR